MKTNGNKLKVLFAASEALPFASTGGLADVMGSLPAALIKENIDARVVMPLYDIINEKYKNSFEFICAATVKLSWRNLYCGIYKTTYNGVIFYFIDNEYYFKKPFLYGSFDDGERFAFFSKAVLDIMPHTDFFPDILNTNDWQSALAVIYLKQYYKNTVKYRDIKAVHTIHNIEYQGEYELSLMEDVFDISINDAYIVEYQGKLNLTKGAVVCCDKLTTVSPNYAEEIKTETFSHGLHYVLNSCGDKITGILNGIDTDRYKPTAFDKSDLSGKAALKENLQKKLAMSERPDVPLISMITRLVPHKGIDLVIRIIDELLAQDIQFIILGTGDADYENFFKILEYRHYDKARSIIKYDKELADVIYSASDIFLMPSKSEPCGLAQMIASQYGTIPLVRETGGLYDSIKKYDPVTGEGNGFTFKNYNAHEMLFSLKDAIKLYSADKDKWRKLMIQAMETDFSWNASAKKYIDLYKDLLNGN